MIYCPYCDQEVPIIIYPKGPHMRADCSQCKRYLKFLSKEEIKEEEDKEDES